jgi:hypothetical protein
MSFLDWLTGKIECPRCGTRGAKRIKGEVYCPNPTCSNFSKTMGESDAGRPADSITLSESGNAAVGSSTYQPASVPAGSIAIRYRDFRGRDRTFIAEVASARRQRNHISVKVGEGKQTVVRRDPQTGERRRMHVDIRLVLSRDRIQNLAEVESSFPRQIESGQDWPTPRERQVMSYHKKLGSTSPLYERIRVKYPNW